MNLRSALPFAAWLLATLAPASAGAFPSALSILGGAQASAVLARDPIAASTVAIETRRDGGIATCTGTIIARDLVLTAAHCVAGSEPARVTVIFERDTDDRWAEVSGVKDFEAHSRYAQGLELAARTGDFDLAVLLLSDPLPRGYRPVSWIAGGDGDLVAGEAVTVAGYGYSEMSADGVLRKTVVPLENRRLNDTEMSLAPQESGEGDVCSGDSGGPAYVIRGGKLVLVGVASRVRKFPRPCYSGSIYTKVSEHVGFIWAASARLRGRRQP